MNDNFTNPPPARKRKMAAARLGIEFEKRYERLALASGKGEIAMRAVELGQLFNDNIEFVIWALKSQGGLNPPNPQTVSPVRQLIN